MDHADMIIGARTELHSLVSNIGPLYDCTTDDQGQQFTVDSS